MSIAHGQRIPPHHPNCLGCGPGNDAGMGLVLFRDGDAVHGEVRFDRRHEGAPGFVHGGAISTVLDDTFGGLLVILQVPAVTANLEIGFRSPGFLDRPLTIEAWAESVEGRKLHLAGRMLDESNVIAEAKALFIEVDVDHFRQSGAGIPDRWAFGAAGN